MMETRKHGYSANFALGMNLTGKERNEGNRMDDLKTDRNFPKIVDSRVRITKAKVKAPKKRINEPIVVEIQIMFSFYFQFQMGKFGKIYLFALIRFEGGLHICKSHISAISSNNNVNNDPVSNPVWSIKWLPKFISYCYYYYYETWFVFRLLTI